jgi:FG-GAP-like repeat
MPQSSPRTVSAAVPLNDPMPDSQSCFDTEEAGGARIFTPEPSNRVSMSRAILVRNIGRKPFVRLSAWLRIVLVATAFAATNGFTNAAYAQAGDDDDRRPDLREKSTILVAAGDFNRDGITDFVEAALPDGNSSGEYLLTVQLGQPDGTYIAVASNNLIGKDPRALVVGDFNGDGNSDVIVGRGDGSVLEFEGNGSGDMISVGKIASLGSVESIAIGHFTHDGNLDLVISDFESNSAVILLGTGDGSFHVTWSFQLPQRGSHFHVATADFNKDGLSDLVITNEDDENYEVMLANGNGTFIYAPELSHLKDPNSYCPS